MQMKTRSSDDQTHDTGCYLQIGLCRTVFFVIYYVHLCENFNRLAITVLEIQPGYTDRQRSRVIRAPSSSFT